MKDDVTTSGSVTMPFKICPVCGAVFQWIAFTETDWSGVETKIFRQIKSCNCKDETTTP